MRHTSLIYKKQQSGQALLIVVIFFVIISSIIIFGITRPIINQLALNREKIQGKQSFLLAEAGVDDVIYRLNNAKTLNDVETINLNGYYATSTITNTAGGKSITSVASVIKDIKKVTSEVTKGAGVVFKYGTQAGQGGIIFGNNAYLDGNLYSNGNIIGSNGAYITANAFVAGATGLISNMRVGYGGTGNAYAHTVTDSTVTGTIYCQSGTSNNKVCNTTQSDPVTEPLPVSDENIAQWKSDAAAGTIINGNKTIAGSETIGPAKIIGDLTISGSGSLTVANTIWVTGKVTFSGSGSGSKVKLAGAYGSQSGIILSDNVINVGNGVTFQDSGSSGSYVMLLTTSSCDETTCVGLNAIDINNNSSIVIANAQNGTVNFSNNSSVKESVGKTIRLKNNVGISYGSGLINVGFTSGPSGSYIVTSWKEVK